jgi:rRNA-processing protein FCF1
MVNLVIDSTHFKLDRALNKIELAKIKALGKRELIKLHIPWFVYRECTSTFFHEIQTRLNSIKTTIRTLNRQGIDNDIQSDIMKVSELLEELSKKIKPSITSNWKGFIEESKSKLYEFDNDMSATVFENYFDGSSPFKSLKNRKDIPDAFIYETIKSLGQVDKTYVITNDNNLFEECEKLLNTRAFKTWENFFSDAEIIEIEKAMDEELDKLKIDLITDNLDLFEDSVLEWDKTRGDLTIEDPVLRSDNNDAEVLALDNLKTKIIEKDIQIIDDDVFVPIEVFADASIYYFVFNSDFYLNFEEFEGASVEEWNKHYVHIEDEEKLRMIKTFRFKKSEITEDDFPEVNIIEFDEIIILREDENGQ